MKTGSFLLALLIAASPAAAQVSVAPLDSAAAHANQVTTAESAQGATPGGEHHGGCEEYPDGDFISPHITDSHCLEVPNGLKIWETREVELPRWAPIYLGKFKVDLSPTKHVVFMLLAAALCCIILITAARAHVKHTDTVGRPKGFASGIEAMVLYIRNEVAMPNLGPHGEGYAPFILSLFFFILFANLLGLVPFGSTVTGNISVTATLAIITFFVVEIAGIRENGFGYLRTIFYWNNDLPVAMRFPMFLLMTPIEAAGKLTKPFALAIRLFANMTAGHIVVLGLIGLVFAFKSYALGLVPLSMALGIMLLELFVSFLQAFVFALLASVFIGQMREGHH
ncbi:F0F1 ATP synthase subunit A [soil metagenome]